MNAKELTCHTIFIVWQQGFLVPRDTLAHKRRIDVFFNLKVSVCYNSFIFILLNHTSLPWSCKRILPSAAFPKFGQTPYLL